MIQDRKEWRKVLYLPQVYPDNYVDPSKFLDGLKKNGKICPIDLILWFNSDFIVFTRTYGLSELVLASGSVVQEFSW